MLVGEVSANNHNKINKRTDPEQANGKEPQNASSDFANVESMDAKAAKEKAKNESDPFVFFTCSGSAC
jgi:hypothetical protein